MIFVWAAILYLIGIPLMFYIIGRFDSPHEKNGYSDRDSALYVCAIIWPLVAVFFLPVWVAVKSFKYWNLPFTSTDAALRWLYRRGVDNAWRRRH